MEAFANQDRDLEFASVPWGEDAEWSTVTGASPTLLSRQAAAFCTSGSFLRLSCCDFRCDARSGAKQFGLRHTWHA